MARNDSFNQPWASAPAQFERPGDGLIARGWAGGASEDPPEAKWENWWHNRVDLALQELQNLGQLIWFTDAPYQAGARVSHGGNSYIALSENTGVEPTGALDIGVWRKEGINAYLQTINNLSEIKAAGAAAMTATRDNIGALSATGTAEAATKLATARKISGVDFDGTKDITLPFINTTDDNIQLAGNLGVKNLEVRGYGTTEGGQIDLFDKDGNLAGAIDIDANGNFRIIHVTLGSVFSASKTTGDIAVAKSFSAAGNISTGNGSLVTTNGNIFATNGNLSVGGRGDITGDLRAGRVLSKSDVIVGEGQAGGYATINSTGNIIGSQWGNAWLSTRTARAFAVFNAKTGAVSGSVGISSVTRNAVGTYTVVFSSAMPGTYAVMVGVDGTYNTHEPTITSKAATSFRILTPGDGGVDYSLHDLNEIQFVVFSTGV